MALDSPMPLAGAAPTRLGTAEWLAAWETAAAQPPGLRELALLQPACGADAEALARLTLGRRDSLLLDLRQALFGARLECTASCPRCGERCEWSCSVDQLREPEPDGRSAASAESDWHGDGWQVRLRCVEARDLAAAQAAGSPAAAARVLLQRCVLGAWDGGREVGAAEIPLALHAELGRALAAADPQALAAVALKCPACGEHWDADVDIGAFLWAEVDVWARRALTEVHRLASRYGWAERDILAMSPARRAHYLALAEG